MISLIKNNSLRLISKNWNATIEHLLGTGAEIVHDPKFEKGLICVVDREVAVQAVICETPKEMYYFGQVEAPKVWLHYPKA